MLVFRLIEAIETRLSTVPPAPPQTWGASFYFNEGIYCLLNVQVLLQFIAGRVPIPVVRLQTKYQTRHAKIKISNYYIYIYIIN